MTLVYKVDTNRQNETGRRTAPREREKNVSDTLISHPKPLSARQNIISALKSAPRAPRCRASGTKYTLSGVPLEGTGVFRINGYMVTKRLGARGALTLYSPTGAYQTVSVYP
jgi:hypothetical protein